MASKFQRRETPSPWPSSNRGWRLGVAFGAVLVLLGIAWFILSIATEVYDV